jgi:large subunit ribosomal protein L19
MSTKLDIFNKTQIKQEAPDIRAGDVVRVHLKLAEKTKKGGQKSQIFEGLIIARKHGKGPNATFTVRKISQGTGVERIFPIYCPSITKIEVVKRSKVRRAKLYYMRQRAGKKARMKTKELLGVEWPSYAPSGASEGKKAEKVEPPEALEEQKVTKSAEASGEGGKKKVKPEEGK